MSGLPTIVATMKSRLNVVPTAEPGAAPEVVDPHRIGAHRPDLVTRTTWSPTRSGAAALPRGLPADPTTVLRRGPQPPVPVFTMARILAEVLPAMWAVDDQLALFDTPDPSGR